MTRETKIGLLVGLGFIVVFAVLLSHNGTGPSPTQSLPPIAAKPAEPSGLGRETLTSSPVSEPDSAHGDVPTVVDNPGDSGPALRDPISGAVVTVGAAGDLPAPTAFDRSSVVVADGPTSTDNDVSSGMAMADSRDDALPGGRVAPTVVAPPAPEPTVRPVAPVVTAAPDTPSSDNTVVAAADNAVTPPSKPYVIQNGDRLVTIAKTVYGKASPEVISFLVDSNKGTIKDRNLLRAGQTIQTPPLPPDMFEPQPTGAIKNGDLQKVSRLINDPAGTRRAPDVKDAATDKKLAPASDPKASKVGKPSLPVGESATFISLTPNKLPETTRTKPDKADKPAAGETKKQSAPPKVDPPPSKPRIKVGPRVYEIQPKDTFTSIAQRELGSKNRWAEIKQMNKGIDPAKMKPGMKIRIPSRDTMSADASMKRASA